MQGMLDAVVVAIVLLLVLVTIGVVMSRLYRRASKERAFVRTGFGGQKVIVNGGALVIPVLHEIITVNMNTLRLDVRRQNEQALITRDRMRVDVAAEFYVRVQPTADAIASAAQTLGRKTLAPEELKQLVEGKFVDALRSVAAEMAMEELHEQRTAFVQKVQQVVTEDLMKNGLELESVSLTGLDQTSREYFNPDNAFDAEGLTRLTESIEARRKKRNEIEQDTQVEIQRKNMEAAQHSLQIQREEEYARLAQQREVETRRASQQAEIAREQAERRREAEQARIQAELAIDQSRIESERTVQDQRIVMEQQLREREIARERTLGTAEAEKLRTVELAEQDRAIAVAERSKDQSLAQQEADRARAEAVLAEEQVHTAREVERAERAKRIELVEAAKEAERNMIGVTIAAEAEKRAAEDHATATVTRAEADAGRERITAAAQADAERVRAEAAARRYEVDAAGHRAINEAANTLSPEQIAMQLRMAVVKALPEVIRESARPMERIDSIRIVQVGGLAAPAPEGAAVPAERSLADQVVNGALRYRVQAPLVEAILKEVGLDGTDLQGLARTLQAPPASADGGTGAGAD